MLQKIKDVNKISFGEILQQVILEKEFTITKLSKQSSISRTHIHRIINNKNEPTIYILKQLSNTLKIDLEEYYNFKRFCQFGRIWKF